MPPRPRQARVRGGHRAAQGAHRPGRAHRARAGPADVQNPVVDGRRVRRYTRGGAQRSRGGAAKAKETRRRLRRVHRSNQARPVQGRVPRQPRRRRAQARERRVRRVRRVTRVRTRPEPRRGARPSGEGDASDDRRRRRRIASSLRTRLGPRPRERRRVARQGGRVRRRGGRARRARRADGTRPAGRAGPAAAAVRLADPCRSR